jgi:aminopeptidase N
MWFGNLVTMRWFDDVWVKEVFASFLADRVVGPAFPEVNHDLRFLVAHLPPAYSVDRTAGTHSIRQPLDNLKGASSLYGPLIYHKAPVVMAQLERLIGAPTLREGLRAYLRRFAFGSASWSDLVGVLREHTGGDLVAWSHAWVGQPGRPTIRTAATRDDRGLVSELGFVQEDPDAAASGHWKQQVDVLVGTAAEPHKIEVALQAGRINVSGLQSLGSIELVLPAVGGPGYGEFVIDEETRQLLLRDVGNLGEPLARGVAWITLWDDLLGRRIPPEAFIEAAIRALLVEDAEQNVELVTGYLERAFWKFLRPDARDAFSLGLEQAFRSGLERSPSPTLKATYFSRFRSVATTPSGLALLEATWSRRSKIDGLTLGEGDEIAMALDLAVRGGGGAAVILEEQRTRISNADCKARFEFVMPAVSERQDVRDAFFRALADVSNRRHEPWVIEGLTYLNHPLRAAAAEKYLQPALELLTEIKDTGHIFFPKNWTDAMLSGHSSGAAADVVRRFLADRPGYPVALRRIILQSADTLFRAAVIANPSP